MRSRIRSLLLLLLLGAVLLEALTWIRAPLFDALHRAYPKIGLDDKGQVVYFGDESPRAGVSWARYLDPARSASESRSSRVALRLAGSRRPYRMNLDFDAPLFLVRDIYMREVKPPPAPLESLAMQLNAFESSRRGLPYQEPGTSLFMPQEPEGPPVAWSAEDGRLVCRDTATGEVVAGLGPDGYRRGDGAAGGGRFGRIDGVFPANREDRAEKLLLDTESRTIHAVSTPKPATIPADSTEPLPLSIEARPLRPFRAGESETETWPFMKVTGRHVLVFLRDGSVPLEVELEPGERIASSKGALVKQSEISGDYEQPPGAKVGDIGIETTLAPCPPDGELRRLRLFRPGEPVAVRDVILTPVRADEVLLANLASAFALLRPPPLAAASTLSALPADHREMWWWRDPWLAAGSALAAFLAWRARRAARERCATVRAVRLWTAAVFLLGPLGLLWMRLVLPRVPVESVGGGRRAVNLDASPSSSAPWPGPEPLGIEVIS